MQEIRFACQSNLRLYEALIPCLLINHRIILGASEAKNQHEDRIQQNQTNRKTDSMTKSLGKLQADKYIHLEKNDAWYGWSDGKHKGQ
mgnify:CR=1 FL=1